MYRSADLNLRLWNVCKGFHSAVQSTTSRDNNTCFKSSKLCKPEWLLGNWRRLVLYFWKDSSQYRSDKDGSNRSDQVCSCIGVDKHILHQNTFTTVTQNPSPLGAVRCLDIPMVCTGVCNYVNSRRCHLQASGSITQPWMKQTRGSLQFSSWCLGSCLLIWL